jgi:YfiH family protein
LSVADVTWLEEGATLRSPLLTSLGLVAGFTTRALGSMAGSVFPLDEQARNRDALARSLGFTSVVRAKQVHGTAVAYVGGSEGDGAPLDRWPVADALWTDRRGVLLGIAAADCVPVLVARRDGPVGVAHAGWDGTASGVTRALVTTLAAAGAEPSTLVAAIGPSIGPCCYAIDAARAATVRERGAGEHLLERDGTTVFDLWSANESQLRAAGIRTIEVARICTGCGGRNLWSYRARDPSGRYGTQLAFIGGRA